MGRNKKKHVRMTTRDDPNVPRGYRLQEFPCCATCRFGGYLGSDDEFGRDCICEILGNCDAADSAGVVLVEPLGICDAWQRT